jgi:ABC-2 type transport system permease protein
MAIAYVLLTVVGLAYNSLAYDGSGLPMLFAAPIHFRDVMVAKNLLHTMIFVAEVIIVFVLVQFVGGPTPPVVVGLTLAGALWAFLMNLTVGNLVSLYSPRKLRLGQMRRQRASGIAVAATLGVQLVVAGLGAGLYFLSRFAGHMAWCGIGFLALAGVARVAYRRVLDLVSDIALKRREAMMAELSRPD